MADRIFEDARLARIYDPLDPDRGDLEAYVGMATAFGARSVLDIGCGTGTLACLLAARGIDVIGLDPAQASLAVAQTKTGADRVRWVHGRVTDLEEVSVDLALMTGNVAQVFVEDAEWQQTLTAVRRLLTAGGRLVFESRDPDQRAWLGWNRDQSYKATDIEGVGVVESWVEVTAEAEGTVSFVWTFVFASDGAVLESRSTLRFRSQEELTSSLTAAGFIVTEVRDAPDRPGLEWVFVALAR